MQTSALDQFYHNLPEPQQGCFLALRQYISTLHPDISQEWKYKLPFFYFRKKMFCYLWIDKKTKHPYIGFSDGLIMKHPLLIQGDRKRMKIFSVNPEEDLPMETLEAIFEEALQIKLAKE